MPCRQVGRGPGAGVREAAGDRRPADHDQLQGRRLLIGWNVALVGPVQDKNLYEAAKQFASSVSTGAVEAKHGEGETKSKDDVPF